MTWLESTTWSTLTSLFLMRAKCNLCSDSPDFRLSSFTEETRASVFLHHFRIKNIKNFSRSWRFQHDVMINRDDCTYQKEGNGDEKFCFAPSTRYASTCMDIGEGNLYHFCEPDCLSITACEPDCLSITADLS